MSLKCFSKGLNVDQQPTLPPLSPAVSSLRRQQMLFELSPTCVCPTFSGMVNALQTSKPFYARARSMESRLPNDRLLDKARHQQKKMKPKYSSSHSRQYSEEIYSGVWGMQNPESNQRSRSACLTYESTSRNFLERIPHPFTKSKCSAVKYQRLAMNSVRLAMSFWSFSENQSTKPTIPDIIVQMERTDGYVKCKSTGDRPLQLLHYSSSQEPFSATENKLGNGIMYSAADLDELRTSVSSEQSHYSLDIAKRKEKLHSYSYDDCLHRNRIAKPPVIFASDFNLDRSLLPSDSINPKSCSSFSHLIEPDFTADVLGKALEMFLLKQKRLSRDDESVNSYHSDEQQQ